MKYLYWVAAAAVVGLGIFFSMNFKIQEKAIPKIKFSQVETPEVLGKGVYERLRMEIQKADVVLLGVTPEQIEDMELWRGFFQANNQPGAKYDILVGDPRLPYLEIFQDIVHMDIQEDLNRLAEGIRKAKESGQRMAVIVPYIYASKLIRKNPAHRLKDEFNIDVTSFSIVKFPVTREQEIGFEPKCELESGRDLIGTGHLGCLLQEIARKTYRKKFEAGKYSGMMEMTGTNDYLILLNRNPNPR